MKILHITPYYPPHIGGLQSHAEQFTQRLAGNNKIITVFTSQLPPTTLPAESSNTFINIIRFPAFEIIPNYPLPKFWQATFWQQWQQLNRDKFDVVISRTRFFFTSLMALRFAKRTHTPWLHIEHGSDFVSLSNPLIRCLARFYDYTLGRLVLSSADKIVANSRASAHFVQKLADRHAHIIYRGVDKETIARVVPVDLTATYPTSTAIITFVGRLIDGKGVDDLLRALKAIMPVAPGKPLVLKEKHQGLRRRDGERNGWHCLIIGDGPKRESLTKLARQLGISKHITFLGQQEFSQAISILKASDIFVNPSHTEGLPTSVIEAALCKTAIIATDVGGTPEIITDSQSGYLIPPKQPAILAQKLQELIANPSLQHTLANNAYHKVITKFSWEESINAYHLVLTDLLA